jgi:hypothetical protein
MSLHYYKLEMVLFNTEEYKYFSWTKLQSGVSQFISDLGVLNLSPQQGVTEERNGTQFRLILLVEVKCEVLWKSGSFYFV